MVLMASITTGLAQKNLVLYYSQNGTTQVVAEELQKQLGADIDSIVAVEPYSGDFQATIQRGNKERESGQWPAIKPLKKKIAALPPLAVFGYKYFTPDTPKTKEGKQAVAELLEYIGKACMSDYTEKSTSAYISKAYHALEDIIRLATKMGYIYASQLGEEAFAEKIYKSLLNGCPVIMSGRKTNDGCHCYIVDGYDAKRNLFHINFGWYGQFNGWYALSATGSNSAGYTINKTAITNIKPTRIRLDVDGNGKIDVNDVMATVDAINSGKYIPEADTNNDGEVSIQDVEIITNHVLGKEKR